VRPQWTECTAAGRAKLSVDGTNWQWAEQTRRLRQERERYTGEWRRHRLMKNAYEAAIAREEQLDAVNSVRSAVQEHIKQRGHEGKVEADHLRRQHAQLRAQWEEHGRALHSVHNNQRARHERAVIEEERRQEATYRRADREVAYRERRAEGASRVRENRARAQRIREECGLAVRSVSEAELRVRQQTYDQMKQEQRHRHAERAQDRRIMLSMARSSHDAVHLESSRDRVAECNHAERERKAVEAAALRANIQRLRRARMHAEIADDHRKRTMHDAVRRAAFEGHALHSPPASPSRRSPEGSFYFQSQHTRDVPDEYYDFPPEPVASEWRIPPTSHDEPYDDHYSSWPRSSTPPPQTEFYSPSRSHALLPSSRAVTYDPPQSEFDYFEGRQYDEFAGYESA
jgi:hypothetical protein